MADLTATQTSNNQNWRTPKWLFDRLNVEFRFDLDVCATEENALCKNYFTEEQNGLEQDWWGTCWCNPPYKDAKLWIKKAYEETSKENCTAVLLIGARTDTRYWWEYVRFGDVRFLPGRLKFEGGQHSAPFPSAVVVFEKGTQYRPPTTYYWDVRQPKEEK